MRKGVLRIIEIVIVLVLMFTLIQTLVQYNPSYSTSTGNIRVLSRYAIDVKNMVCNNERDRVQAFSGSAMTSTNSSIVSAVPAQLRFRVYITSTTDGSVIKSFGYTEPDLGSAATVTDVAATSCVITSSTGADPRNVVVHTWWAA
jgi:hypothetical protein